MTNLQLLLDYLSPEQSIKEAAIIQYFNVQDAYEFVIEDTEYVLLNSREVKNILTQEAREECESFLRDVATHLPFYRDTISVFSDNINDLADYLVDSKDATDVQKYQYIDELDNSLYLFSE